MLRTVAGMVRGSGAPRHLRHLVRDLDAMGDGTGRSLVQALSVAKVWERYFQIVRWREGRAATSWTVTTPTSSPWSMPSAGGCRRKSSTRPSVRTRELRDTTFWRIFEVPGTRRVNLAYLDRYRGEAGQG